MNTARVHDPDRYPVGGLTGKEPSGVMRSGVLYRIVRDQRVGQATAVPLASVQL